ncbi:LysR family transcriptional regulator [Shewanella sp. Scap07]|uniref:LysR family transcriptional regulator n=1 Tax=Shewanella sp. Scap07 TaxID=2589987 RepID=UPI0015BA9DB1|nr:LysR family transcriptional regulator [Shewanella sp. Scap07]QLE86763.1 LysR family transcriptional regulator [Shewanella sp. Scap07]
MRDISFSNLDLLSINILVNLYEYKSATYVSNKLNVPAPKISRCLKHAREIFGNELFIRKKYGLIPNEFAGKVYPIAKQILECSNNLQQLNGEVLAEHVHDFEIVAPDLVSFPFPKMLLTSIRDAGKEVNFNISPWSKSSLKHIVSGDIDIGLCCCKTVANLETIDENLAIVPLEKLNKLFLICDDDHPILKEDITLESIAKYPYVNSNIGDAEQRLSTFQEYCCINNIPLNTEMDLNGVSSLFEYLRKTDAVALLPYSSIYNVINSTPGLHACQLAKVESERLYMEVKAPTLYMIYNRNNHKMNFHWLSDRLQDLVHTALH